GKAPEPRTLGVQGPTVDEVRALDALRLEPRRAAPRRVRQVPALRPDPLEPHAAGAREELPAVAYDVLRVAEAARRFRAEQVGEPRLPLLERQRGDVLAVDVQEVEHEVGELAIARG